MTFRKAKTHRRASPSSAPSPCHSDHCKERKWLPMDSLICWCADCGDDAVFDAVPDVLCSEYVCRTCSAAAFIADVAVVERPAFVAA